MMRLSTHLPKYPAMPPRMTPITVAMISTMKPISRETRPPYMSRVSMSIPLRSVPSQCVLLGDEYVSYTRVAVDCITDQLLVAGS